MRLFLFEHFWNQSQMEWVFFVQDNVNEHENLPWESLHWQITFPRVKIWKLKMVCCLQRWSGLKQTARCCIILSHFLLCLINADKKLIMELNYCSGQKKPKQTQRGFKVLSDVWSRSQTFLDLFSLALHIKSHSEKKRGITTWTNQRGLKLHSVGKTKGKIKK